ncbi:hypothetical protein KAU19_01700 [Candidatus Parcubacteria bacterium]|nr:hypothetical protein [Candidatus Parcubacteria bacterium]
MEQEELKKLLEENLKLTEEIHKMTKGIKSFVLWQRIFGVIKILIIVVPIVLAAIFIPRLIEDVKSNPEKIINNPLIEAYLGGIIDSAAQKADMNKIDINSIPEQYRQYLK